MSSGAAADGVDASWVVTPCHTWKTTARFQLLKVGRNGLKIESPPARVINPNEGPGEWGQVGATFMSVHEVSASLAKFTHGPTALVAIR